MMLQVIMVARLHAMYQRSRAMLICLVIILLVVNISCVVLSVIGIKYFVGGKFHLLLEEHTHWANTRGGHTLWHSYVRL
jgi:hypothetical protein